ncbi:MAG: menaquinone biosynthesis protein [Candidatus Delongbacteria bacterium]|nr:menaquinone biosynthesis protein [Candidatus Delongbacteria bacterium]MBN2836558.1 menaquinone biosynthesis protein [Candidatus Delongbacteria bacterium]
MLKVGGVNFINAYPLVKNLDCCDLLLDVPSKLADKLRARELDLAIISSIEYAKMYKDLSIVPDLCIGSENEILSILLISKKPLGEIKTVGYDFSTRSSIVLLKIILEEIGKNKVYYTEIEPDPYNGLRENDAVLLIGDNAMKFHNFDIDYKYDLGLEWKIMTGLPFVFALWAGYSNIDIDIFSFKTTYMNNSQNINSLLSDYENNDYNRNYLQNIVKYELSSDRIEGMKLFFKKAYNYGFINELPEIRFYTK